MKKINLFIGYVGKVGQSSVSIRNQWLIDQLGSVQTYTIGNDKSRLRNIITLLKATFRIVFDQRISNIYVSTNPKILGVLACIKPKKSQLFMGDPYLCDSSRATTRVEKLI